MTGVFTRLYWWHVGIAIGSVIALYTNTVLAQIIPDATLPNNSNVTLEGNAFNITQGSTTGGNLFHSFKDFSVPTGSSAFFNNAFDIQNIISRVTGKSISNIDGLIKANGAANLFLINPNGIIFGENARVNIGGSFLATGATSMKFASGFEFSAVNPESTPLLTITAPVGLQFGANPGLIQVQGNTTDSPIDTRSGLRVEPDKTLALVGGDINLEGATLETAGGRIELGSVAAHNLVSLTPTNFGFALGYSGVQNFGNIQLSQQTTVDASGEGGGDIQVQGKRITVTNGSHILTSTLGAKQGGDLIVNATESVEVSGLSSGLYTVAYSNATGDAGNLSINTRELIVRDGAAVSSGTSSAGKGGNLTVNALTVKLIGVGESGDDWSSSGLFSDSEATGNAGNLTINTRELLVRDGATVSSGTSGAGSGGNLTVNASIVELIGESADGQSSSGLFSATEETGTGDAGNLTINTRELLVRDGATVSSGTLGIGKGGNLTVNASIVELTGESADGQSFSSLSSNSEKTGDAGNLTINTRELLVRDGAVVSSSALDAGSGGNLILNASTVELIGESTVEQSSSGLFSDSEATGDAGNLTINTRELLVRDGAAVSSATSGAGKGGDLTVNALTVELIGVGKSADDWSSSGLFSDSETTGDAGNLTINTRELLVRDGAEISTATSGAGKGGDLTVNAKLVQVIGRNSNGFSTELTGLASTSTKSGNAGNLKISTQQLLVQDGGGVYANSIVQGKAGNIIVDANSIQLNNHAKINADTKGGGGNIFLNSPLLLLRRGSSITTIANGNNITGGNINIDAKNGFIVAIPSENSDIGADSAKFRGGNVMIKNTAGIFGIQARKEPSLNTSDITAKGATPDLSGNIQIPAPDVDPSKSLIQLPVSLVDASNQISNACTPGNPKFDSTFTVTGRGGLPISPNEPLQDQSTDSTWVRFQAEPESNTVRINQPSLIAAAPTIIEASGWIADQSGNIELVAPDQTPQTSHSVSCSVLK